MVSWNVVVDTAATSEKTVLFVTNISAFIGRLSTLNYFTTLNILQQCIFVITDGGKEWKILLKCSFFIFLRLSIDIPDPH